MISNERLEDIADERLTERQIGLDSSEVISMAKELLALRKAREGWKLVPVEPTEEMKEAYYRDSVAPVSKLSKSGYRAMLAAAPEPE